MSRAWRAWPNPTELSRFRRRETTRRPPPPRASKTMRLSLVTKRERKRCHRDHRAVDGLRRPNSAPSAGQQRPRRGMAHVSGKVPRHANAAPHHTAHCVFAQLPAAPRSPPTIAADGQGPSVLPHGATPSPSRRHLHRPSCRPDAPCSQPKHHTQHPERKNGLGAALTPSAPIDKPMPWC